MEAMINGYGLSVTWTNLRSFSIRDHSRMSFYGLALCDRCEDFEGRIPIFNEKEAERGKKKIKPMMHRVATRDHSSFDFDRFVIQQGQGLDKAVVL